VSISFDTEPLSQFLDVLDTIVFEVKAIRS